MPDASISPTQQLVNVIVENALEMTVIYKNPVHSFCIGSVKTLLPIKEREPQQLTHTKTHTDRTVIISLHAGKATRSYNNRYHHTTTKLYYTIVTIKLMAKEGDRARLSKQGDPLTGMQEAITGQPEVKL